MMKKLTKLKLSKVAEMLNDNEMKMISGGYSDGYSGKSICYWEESSVYYGCTRNPDEAYLKGENFWCCNCNEAYTKCGWMG